MFEENLREVGREKVVWVLAIRLQEALRSPPGNHLGNLGHPTQDDLAIP